MSFDLKLFGKKLSRCRENLQLSTEEVVGKTGIIKERILVLEAGEVEPSGDEVLILSDFYRQDYQFFISNEQKSASEQVDILYRKFASALSKSDRWAIQEFIYLCECEDFVLNALEVKPKKYAFQPLGKWYNKQGIAAAINLREFLGIRNSAIIPDLYLQIRRMGIHVFRRRLENSSISGLMINHPYAGQCVLVNYHEDIFRQNFTVAHETGHAIFDFNESVNISFLKDDEKDLREIRANAFASELLVPREAILKLSNSILSEDLILKTALTLKVNPQVLLIALKNNKIITYPEYKNLLGTKIPKEQKTDPELTNLSERIVAAKLKLLERGLSSFYVRNCHEAYTKGIISANRLAEMLLCAQTELSDLLSLFNLKLSHDY